MTAQEAELDGKWEAQAGWDLIRTAFDGCELDPELESTLEDKMEEGRQKAALSNLNGVSEAWARGYAYESNRLKNLYLSGAEWDELGIHINSQFPTVVQPCRGTRVRVSPFFASLSR